jgi:glycosyltransferase involved in cell wall biosynthesis
MINISIIIPIYKVEQYLTQCLESLNVFRKAVNIEVILVDDGSPDNCGKICDEYASKHDDAKVIHQKNAGLSAARNAGIDASTGDYLWFIDSDDFINDESIGIIKAIEQNDADIYFFGTKVCDENGNVNGETRRGMNTGYHSPSQVFQAFRFPFSGVPFSVFRRSVFKNKRFKVGIISEDWQFIIRSLVFANKCYVIDSTPYCYRIRASGSITHSAKTFRYVRDDVDIAQDFYDCLKDKSLAEDNRMILYSGICAMLVSSRKLVLGEIKDKKEKREALQYFFTKSFWKGALHKGGNWKQWIQYYMLVIYSKLNR